jgi:predicted nucleic acid-binding protein
MISWPIFGISSLWIEELLRSGPGSAVTTRQFTKQISRDADDAAVLACVLAARAGLIVSGDRDLLTLTSFRNIPIVTVAEAVVVLATK